MIAGLALTEARNGSGRGLSLIGQQCSAQPSRPAKIDARQLLCWSTRARRRGSKDAHDALQSDRTTDDPCHVAYWPERRCSWSSIGVVECHASALVEQPYQGNEAQTSRVG